MSQKTLLPSNEASIRNMNIWINTIHSGKLPQIQVGSTRLTCFLGGNLHNLKQESPGGFTLEEQSFKLKYKLSVLTFYSWIPMCQHKKCFINFNKFSRWAIVSTQTHLSPAPLDHGHCHTTLVGWPNVPASEKTCPSLERSWKSNGQLENFQSIQLEFPQLMNRSKDNDTKFQ